MQCAIARRINLPASVCAAIAEVGTAAAALELIENAYAELAPFSWDRIVERHGHLAAIRESMLVLEDLARGDAGRAGRKTLGHAGAIRGRPQLAERRSRGRIASEARERSTVNIAARSRGDDMRGLVRHLRATGQLTAGLILRALLSGNLELFDQRCRNCPACRRPASPRCCTTAAAPACRRCCKRAGLPESTFAAFRVALEVSHETGFVDTLGGAARLRRRMVERVLTHCETDPSGRRAAPDPAAALCDRVGAGRSPHCSATS